MSGAGTRPISAPSASARWPTKAFARIGTEIVDGGTALGRGLTESRRRRSRPAAGNAGRGRADRCPCRRRRHGRRHAAPSARCSRAWPMSSAPRPAPWRAPASRPSCPASGARISRPWCRACGSTKAASRRRVRRSIISCASIRPRSKQPRKAKAEGLSLAAWLGRQAAARSADLSAAARAGRRAACRAGIPRQPRALRRSRGQGADRRARHGHFARQPGRALRRRPAAASAMACARSWRRWPTRASPSTPSSSAAARRRASWCASCWPTRQA